MVKGLLFDLDGVIVDTAKYHYLAWKQIADKLKIPFQEADNERLKGVSRTKCFEILLEIGNLKMSQEQMAAYCERKNAVYLSYIKSMQADEILPGVSDFIGEAKETGYRIALGSASKNSRLILDKLDLTGLFDGIIDGTSVTKAKPDPEVFIKGARALNLTAEECIVFEDAAAGIEAAHNAGMAAVGVGDSQTLAAADYIIHGFKDISVIDILERLGNY